VSKKSNEFDALIGYGVGVTFAVALAVAVAIVIGFLAIPLIILALAFVGWRFYEAHQNSPPVLERKARERTWALYEDAKARAKPLDKTAFGKGITRHVPVSVPDQVYKAAIEAGLDMYDVEAWGGSIPEPPAICNSIEGARYRDYISKASAMSEHDIDAIQRTIGASVREPLHYVVGMEDGDSEITQPLTSFIPLNELGETVENMILPYFAQNVSFHFKELRGRLDRNFEMAKSVMPSEYKGDDPVFAYLQGTPLIDVMNIGVPIVVPRHIRHEHTVITGGSGHGKTTLLENLILRDLNDPEEPSIVVIDSQRALISKISRLAAVHERPLIIIDPKDAPALNVFGFSTERFARYGQAERERVRNHTLEIFGYLFDSLLGADLTVRQSALFNYLIQVMLAMPMTMGRNATLADIITFTEKSEDYAPAMDGLDAMAKTFFATDFTRTRYNETKEQVRYRLHAILGNSTISRLFLAEKNNVDFYTELNRGAIILIDTDKGFLGAKNSAYLGRIATTLILQAILERDASGKPEREVFMYVDEAGEYFDRSIDKFLTEARKQRAGITLAHQFFGQMSQELRSSVAANTATKYAGGLSAADARTAAADMRTTPEFLLEQQRLTFACHIRNVTKAPTTTTAKIGLLEKEPQITDATYEVFRERNRRRLEAKSSATPPAPTPPPSSEAKEAAPKKKTKLATDPSEYE
jgi:hypothetical protein